MASNSNTLYVTFVDVDCNLLKIWGQRHRIGASYIEKHLLQLAPELNATQSLHPSLIHKGMLCYAKHLEDNYYRARIISNVQGDSVGVLFVDYGNRNIIHVSNIKIRGGTEDVMLKMAEQAEEFYLAKVIAPVGGWSKEIIGAIRNKICNKELVCNEVAQIEGQKFIELKYCNEDLSNYLVAKQMAQSVLPNIQSQMIQPQSRHSGANIVLNNRQPETANSPPAQMGRMISGKSSSGIFHKSNSPVNYSPPVQYLQLDQMNPGMYNTNKTSPTDSYYNSVRNSYLSEKMMKQTKAPFDSLVNNQSNSMYSGKEKPEQLLNNGMIEALAQQIKQYIADGGTKKLESNEENIPHNYVSNVLKVGSTHNVFISSVDDGPWSFSIQLVSSEDELNRLMEELASAQLIPVKPPIVLGHPCIVASAIYGNLCRGVVISISHSAARVYLVDFGDTESLPISAIYELPHKFFKTRVLSQKFCLTGLQNVPYSEEIKEYFKEVVQDKLLIIKVASLEGDNLPCCELYIQSKNIKRMLNEKIQNARSGVENSDPEVGDTENVVVTWVESLQRFYVQLHKRDYELNALKNALSQADSNQSKLAFNELKIGLHCICKYMEDGQWYRARITSMTSQKNIGVFYIDYGNSETVDISLLRKITSHDLIAQMKNQAIQCCLHGFERQAYNKELSNELENLTLEKDLQMTVVATDRDLLIVKLFMEKEDIAKMIRKPQETRLRQSASDKTHPEISNTSNLTHSTLPGEHDKTKPKEKTKKNSKAARADANRVEKDDWRADMQKFGEIGSGVSNNKRNEGTLKVIKADNEKRFVEINTQASGEKRFHIGGDKANWTHKQSNKGMDLQGPNKKLDDGRVVDKRGRSESNDSNKKSDKRNKNWFESNKNHSQDGHLKKKSSIDSFDSSEKFKKAEHTKKTKCPIPKDDLAAPGSTFCERTVNIGSTEKAVITYYINPHEFYIQILTEEERFKKMMQDIQTYYSDKYTIKHHLAKGDIVVAKFSYDNIIYRGEVVTPSPLVVRYVDYGNQEEVGQMRAWMVAKQFLGIPKQAVKCKLSNLSPVETQWPPLGSRLDEYFDSEEYYCTFLNCDNGVYEVELESLATRKNITSEIIAGGFGVLQENKLVIPGINYSLLSKQILKVRVSYVASIEEFYVVLNEYDVEKLQEELKKLSENKELKPVEKSSLRLNSNVLVGKHDGCWARGRILTVNENNYSVCLIDQGNTIEVTSDKMRSVPKYLEEMPVEVVKCSLNSPPESFALADFKNTIEFKDILISVIYAEDERLFVDVFEKNGSQLFSKEESQRCVEPVGQLPVTKQNVPVVISHFETPREIYIQYRAHQDKFVELSKELVNFYENSEATTSSGNPGDLVAVKISPQTWRRCRVLRNSSQDEVDVLCIDTGKTEKVSRENVKILDSSLWCPSALARKVSLDVDVSTDLPDEINGKIEALKDVDELFAYFINENGEMIVEFVSHNVRITPTLVSNDGETSRVDKFEMIMGNAKILASETVQTSAVIEHKTNDLKVFVIHIDSPNQFWIHKESSIVNFQEFQEKLQASCKKLPDKVNPKVGDVVAAMFGDVWFRALIENVTENLLTVKFIDYGNVIEVDLSSECVKELPFDLVNVPIFTTKFSLRGKWKEEATAKFEEIILEYEDPVTAVLLEEGDPVVVDLFKDGKSIFEELVEAGMAENDGDIESSDGDLSIVYITHCESPSNFYIQRHSSTEMLEAITKKLSEMTVREIEASAVKENEIYAAKFPEDDLWYRANVLVKSDDRIQVLFIDYGNMSDVKEVAVLEDDLKEIPPIGENCSLVLGQNAEVWSEEACKRFEDYADGRPLQMKVVLPDRKKKSIVKIYSEGQNVAEELAKFCPDDGRFNANVTHVNSLNDFYVRRVKDDQFKSVNRILKSIKVEELAERSPGTLCLASVPTEDGEMTWRRAKITQNLNEKAKVFLIDYGKTLIVSEVKKPTNDVLEIPPTALHCRLNLPDKSIPKTCQEEFVKWTRNEEKVFRVRIVESGPVNLVSLKSDGLILEDILMPDAADAGLKSDPVTGHSQRSNFDDVVASLEDETDDDKNSKRALLNESLDSDVPSGDSLHNETDEEKEIKIRMGDGNGNSGGFKSDDEKEYSEALSSHVNATDNELMEEFDDTLEEMPKESVVEEDGKESGDIIQESAGANEETDAMEISKAQTVETEDSPRISSPGSDTKLEPETDRQSETAEGVRKSPEGGKNLNKTE